MNRIIAGILVVLCASNASASVRIAWPQLDGVIPKLPEEKLSPAELIDRITKNARKAADRLQDNDPSAATRAMQRQTLRDIDELLKPPPDSQQSSGGGGGGNSGGGGGGGGQEKSAPPQSNAGSGRSSESSGSGESKPEGTGRGSETKSQQGSGSAGESKGESKRPDPPPKEGKEGHEPQSRGRRREKRGGSPSEQTQQAQGNPTKPGEGKGRPQGGMNSGKSAPPAMIPPDDAVVKRIWGHLPEKLREKMNHYYKERFMPKYDDLLREYYSSLNEMENAREGKR